MDKKNALMEAVAEKVGKRAPAFKRKGPGKPGLAVMIAVGAPKAGMKPAMKPEMKSPMGKDAGEDEGESGPGRESLAEESRAGLVKVVRR